MSPALAGGFVTTSATRPLKAERFPWLVAKGSIRGMRSQRKNGHIIADLKLEGWVPGKECRRPVKAESGSLLTARKWGP